MRRRLRLAAGLAGAAVAVLASQVVAAPAQAAKPAAGPYIPPVSLQVTCAPVASVANAPRGTKVVYYTFYTTNDTRFFDSGLGAWNARESGPGYTAPSFPQVYQKGGSLFPTRSDAVMVFAEAFSREGATKPLAWGFSTCFGNAAVPIIFGSQGYGFVYRDGVITRI